MVQQTGLPRPDCEVIDAFGTKESDLRERFALSLAALSGAVRENRQRRCYRRGWRFRDRLTFESISQFASLLRSKWLRWKTGV